MPGCKIDIYFLADNTGSMGQVIDDIQANAIAMLGGIASLPGVNAVFGVGNYRDFPTSYTDNPSMAFYGGRYTTPIANISIGVGATVTATFAPGPVGQGTGTWPGAVTATYASPISSITISTIEVRHGIDLQLLFDWEGTNSNDVTVEVTSSISGVLSTHLFTIPAATQAPWRVDVTQTYPGLVIGEILSIEITNDSTKTIELRWDSALAIRSSSGFNPTSGYAYLHQLDPTNDTAIVADSFNTWYANDGGDYPEGWLYALDQLCEATFWRSNTYKVVVVLGDSPPHDPICTTISGLAYSIDEASITAKLLLNNIVVIAASVNLTTSGLDDSWPTADNYEIFCGPGAILAGHMTRITAATGGYILQQPDPDEAANTVIALISQVLGDCNNIRTMPFATVIGAN